MGFFHSLPVPELREWNYPCPFPFPNSQMSFPLTPEKNTNKTISTCRGNTTSVSMNETGLPENPAIYTQCATLADCNACTYEYDDFVSISVNHIFTFQFFCIDRNVVFATRKTTPQMGKDRVAACRGYGLRNSKSHRPFLAGA